MVFFLGGRGKGGGEEVHGLINSRYSSLPLVPQAPGEREPSDLNLPSPPSGAHKGATEAIVRSKHTFNSGEGGGTHKKRGRFEEVL